MSARQAAPEVTVKKSDAKKTVNREDRRSAKKALRNGDDTAATTHRSGRVAWLIS
jgi:hypothetical protein